MRFCPFFAKIKIPKKFGKLGEMMVNRNTIKLKQRKYSENLTFCYKNMGIYCIFNVLHKSIEYTMKLNTFYPSIKRLRK